MLTKRIYLFGALALPLIMGGCSNDLIDDASQNNQEMTQGKTVQLSDGFRLFASRDAGAQTRGEWMGTKFYWMPEGVVNSVNAGSGDLSGSGFTINALPTVVDASDAENKRPDLKFDEVGLCWLGATPGDEIFTNYMFVHDGWLENGAKGSVEEIVDCDPTTGEYLSVWNWVKYKSEFGADYSAEGKKMTFASSDDGVIGTFGAKINAFEVGSYNKEANKKKIEKVNLSKGTFKTDNKSIFTGKYLAYYPYDSKMVERGLLEAKTATEQTAPVNYNSRLLEAGKYTFAAGVMLQEIKGGTTASGLTMSPISNMLSFKVDESAITGKNIQHMILLSAGNHITKTMKIKASSLEKGSVMEGAEIENAQAVRVDFVNEAGVISSLVADRVVANANDYNRVIVPVLPSAEEIKDMQVLLINDKGYATMTKAFTVKTGVGEIIPIDERTLGYKDGFSNFGYVAWDQTSLLNAITNMPQAGGKILLIGKVVVNENIIIPSKVTVTGFWNNVKVGELVVAATNAAQRVFTVSEKATLDCDVTVEGKGCCHKFSGFVDAKGMTFAKGFPKSNNDHINTLTNNGVVLFSANENTINGKIINENLKYVDGLKDAGTDEVYALPFETEEGTYNFDDKTYKGAVIAIATLTSVQLNNALENNTSSTRNGKVRKDALIVLQKRDVKAFPNNDQDARLVINENGSIDNFATIRNQATIANNSGDAGKLKNEVHATFVNMIGGQLNGYMMDKEPNSNFISQVDNSIDSRYSTALNDHLTNIIEILPVNDAYKYQSGANHYPMANVNNTGLKYVINNDDVMLYGSKSTDYTYTPVDATIAAIEVVAGKTGFTINKKDANANPVNLNVDVTTYNETHKAVEEVLVNNLYPVAIPAVKTGAGSQFSSLAFAQEGITLNVTGNVDFNGTEWFGDAEGKNTPIVTVKGDVNVKGTTSFGEKVVKGTIDGNLTIAQNATVNFYNDVKIKVGVDKSSTKGKIQNNGTFNIQTATGTKSPAVVYCKSYNLTGGTWLNGGRPTPFTAGGVQDGDYAW